MLTLLKQSSYVQMPWKNKRGTTAQILISPADATVDKMNFTYRLSTAPVIEDGLFSKFPGYQRLLIPVRGKGFSLNGALYEQHEIAAFSGDDDTHCELVKGEVVDLGLIYDSKKVKALAKVMRLKDLFSFSTELNVKYLIYVLQGDIEVNETKAAEGETIVLEQIEKLSILAAKRSSIVLFSISEKI